MNISTIFGNAITCGAYERFYESLIPFTHAEKNYILFHSSGGNAWFIANAENLDFGIDNALSRGSWSCFFEVLNIFHSENNTFLFAHSSMGKRWCTMMFDEETCSFNKIVHDGQFDDFYKCISIFDIKGEPTMLRHRSKNPIYSISRIFDDAPRSFNYPIAEGVSDCFYDVLFNFIFADEHYIFAHGRQSKSLNIYKFTEEFNLNKPLLSITSDVFYDHATPFVYKGKTFICARSSSSRRYCYLKIYMDKNGLKFEKVFEDKLFSFYENIVIIPQQKNTCLFHRRKNCEWAVIDFLVYESASWQQQLDSKKSICDITLPGTHDSCANLPLPYGKCQRMSIREQLENGVRFLDIRCRHIDDAFTMHHDIYYLKQNFDDVLYACKEFIEANPSEYIILSIKEEYKPENNTRRFEDTLFDYIEKYPELFYTKREIPTVKDVRGKFVLFSRYADNTIGIDASEWADNATFETKNAMHIQDEYFLPILKMDKWDIVLKQLECAEKNRGDGKLYINYCSGTNVLRADAPKAIAKNTNRKLYEYCIEKKSAHCGIIVLDYPELPNKELMMRIIDMNYHSNNKNIVK